MTTIPDVPPEMSGDGFSLSEGTIVSSLAQDGGLVWLLCQDLTQHTSCILATAASDESTFQVTPLLKNTFSLREHIASEWGITAHARTVYHGRYALVYPPFSFRCLAGLIGLPPRHIADFLNNAIRLCTPLGQMHQQGLVHGDIKPASFFINDEGEYRLAGFGLSSVGPTVQQPLSAVSGSLAWISPEHTGRTPHPVTALSDLYSLGVVLYQMLTGKLPLGAPGCSQSEWVHHHIASAPRPLNLLRADVPPVLSTILLRLLEKSPDKRYQTVEGLLADLRRCLATLNARGDIASFSPGLQDIPPVGYAGDALFSEHPQAQELLAACEAVAASGKHCLVVVSGATGSGKSALLASALKPLQQSTRLLTLGKVDHHSPMLPYAVLTSALRALALHLLGLPTEEVARWKGRILRLVGDYAGLAVNLVPELGVLLNQRALPPTDVHSLDARAQFTRMACNLIKAFATSGTPLVMLIDDVHAADRASLQLLEQLFSHGDDIPFLLVVSHAENSSRVSENLSRLRASAARVVDITPEPLSVRAVSRWLATILHTRPSATMAMAQIIHGKTLGNPLFTHEFFRQAVEDDLITLPKPPSRWSFDSAALQACQYTENVVSLVLQRLDTLPQPGRALLGSLACMGASGSLPLFCTIAGQSMEAVHALLASAIDAQLLSLTGDAWAFTHDSVHKASLGLSGPQEQDRLHALAAEHMAGLALQAAGNEMLFRTVYHVARVQDSQRLLPQAARFSQLAILAAQRAKSTGDYSAALRFLRTARRLLPPDVRDEQAFILHLEEAECTFLQGDLPAAQALCARLLAAPGKLTDKVVAVCLTAEIHMRQSDSALALETAIAWLAVFGIHLNRYPDKAECDAARIRLKARVGKNPYTTFRPLPLMNNRETEAVMNLMASASMFAAFVAPKVQFLIVCEMLHLTMEQGMTGASTFALSWYGVLCGDRYDEYGRGFSSALLARELVEQHDFTSFKARTLMPLDQVSIWIMPVSYAIACAKDAFTAAVANGDRTSACLALRHQIMNYLTRGDHLDGVLTTIERGLAYVRKARYPDVELILQMQRSYVLHLRSLPEGPFSGDNFFQPTLLELAPGTAVEPVFLMQFWSLLYKGMAHFYAGEYSQARRCFLQAEPLTGSIPGHIHMLDFHLYSALSLTIPLAAGECLPDAREIVQRHFDKVALWAAGNARTFADKAALLEAEMLRLDGNHSGASATYEHAIELAGKGGFEQINGLACELAARNAADGGLAIAADAYLRGAIGAWQRFGAAAKVYQLEEVHPHLTQRHSGREAVLNPDEAVNDLQSVATAVRALTEEINLDRLINILMRTLLERARAQRCLMIRLVDDNTPEIEAVAESTAEGIGVQIVNAAPLDTDLPLSVLSAVIRTGQEIRTGKPEVFSPFSQDPYLVASGAAVMCIPMYRQARMVGVLYLENRLMPDAFTAEHSRIIGILSAQAAVSLESARLYAELLEENVQRRRVEKALRASQTSLMLGEKISHTGTWRWTLEHDMMMVSDEYSRILDLPESQRTISMADFLTRVHPDDYVRISELVTESVRGGVSMRADFRILRPDGECRYIKGIGDPVDSWPEVKEYFGTITDITAQRQAEDAVRSAQADLARVSRATTVGQLTASIAHEINQPLMSIVANAGASLRWLKRDVPHLENACLSLDEIIGEGKRAGDIIRGLQALTRNQASVFARENLHDIARHILSLTRLELERKWIALELDYRATCADIFCDSVQIQQVLLNLIVNAVDAMMLVEDRPRILRLVSSNPSPETLLFEVTDSGPGISPDILRRVFDSFYTTKKEGMGMGLTISKGIIHRHRGELKAENREEGGSRFWFTLPVDNPAD